MATPSVPSSSSALRGRACLDAVRVAVHLLEEWGEDLLLATGSSIGGNGEDAAVALLEVAAAAREMVARLEPIAAARFALGGSSRNEREGQLLPHTTASSSSREHLSGAGGGAASSSLVTRRVQLSSTSMSASSRLLAPSLLLSPSFASPLGAAGASPSTSSSSSSSLDVRSAVLLSPDLVGIIIGFLVDGTGGSRDPLRAVSEVCRIWRDASRSEDLWEPIAKDLFPVLKLEGGALEPLMNRGGGPGGGGSALTAAAAGGGGGGASRRITYRQHVLDYGRCLLRREIEIGEPWYAGLQLSFEIFDPSDGHSFMSATGPIGVAKGDFIEFRLQGTERRELTGPPFSAISRDPELRRFTSMRDYFERCHEEQFQSSICVRVTVMDERTGRMALLWEVSSVKRVVKLPNQYWEAFLPTDEGSFVVVEDGWVPVNCAGDTGPELTGLTNFYVTAEPGQEDVPEAEKLYRLAGGNQDRYQDHLSFFALLLKPADTDVIKKFIRSLLDRD